MLHSPYTVSLFSTNTGALSARLDHTNGTFLHLHSLVDPEMEAEYFSTIKIWGDRVLLAGCGLGYHLKKNLMSITPDAKILLLEYYDELAAYSKKMISRIVGNAVTVITNNDEDWESIVKEFVSGGKFIQIIRHPPSFRANEAFYRPVLKLAQTYRLSVKTANTFILMQGGFFAEQELSAAAQMHGAVCASFWYKENDDGALYEAALQKMIQTSAPEAIVSINMLGIDPDGILSEYAQRYGIPVVNWFVDDPRPILLNRKKLITSDMIACTWERSYIPFLKSSGFSKVNYLPLAADPAQFTTASRALPVIAIGFIGSSMGRTFLDGIAAKFVWKPDYERIAVNVAGMLLDGFTGDLDPLILEASKKYENSSEKIDDHSLTWLRSYCIHFASMMKRKRYVSIMQPMNIEVFGDPDGWKELCGPSLLTHPDLDYRTAIAPLYRRIKVNLNITSCQMPTAVNQRVFDVPLCDSFILNDNQSDLGELFSEDEYVVYQSSQELLEKAAFFLKNQEARVAISKRAQKRILNEHTYRHRLQKILSMV
jgi:spore maturation protein CgeB